MRLLMGPLHPTLRAGLVERRSSSAPLLRLLCWRPSPPDLSHAYRRPPREPDPGVEPVSACIHQAFSRERLSRGHSGLDTGRRRTTMAGREDRVSLHLPASLCVSDAAPLALKTMGGSDGQTIASAIARLTDRRRAQS